jgi:hypothetical protein
MITLVIPAYSCGPDIERTIASCKGVCDEAVFISTSPYPDEVQGMKDMGATVVELPWNFTYHNGFGELHNQGAPAAKNDWLLLFGVAETLAEQYTPLIDEVRFCRKNAMLRCDHVNDPNRWKRLYNRQVCRWSGIIHEEVTGGILGEVVFRMQDTDKTPNPDPLRSEVFRHLKSTLYHHQYRRLRGDNGLLGATNPGWINFVNGSKEANEAFISEHADLMEAFNSGDFQAFERGVANRIEKHQPADAVNYAALGQPRTDE